MHALIVTAGSHGDINPFIAIGRSLVARGHSVQMLANPYYEHQVREAGLGFEPLGEYIDLKNLGELYPDIMHPRKAAKVVIDAMIVPTSREAFKRVHALAALVRPDVVLTHIVCPGAAWAAEQLGIPCAHVSLAPMNWLSRHEPIVGAGFMPANPPMFIARLLRAIMIPVLGRTFDAPLARLRTELGLLPAKKPFLSVMLGGDANLGMWSPHLRGPLPDDPPRGTICGFPWHDRHGEVESAPDEVDRFIDAGEPPILFCLGTAAVHVAGDFYELAAEACRIVGKRGLLLVGPGRVKDRTWPSDVRAFAYAPFSTVMPRCLVNVHHGGIGSTGQALRAGRPTVVIPHAHDQWDNAARVLRLGVSKTLPRNRVTPRRFARVLAEVLENPLAARKAAAVGKLLADEDGAAFAAGAVEELARTHGRPRRPAR